MSSVKDAKTTAAAAATAADRPEPGASSNASAGAGDDSSEDSSQEVSRRKKKARTTFTGRQIFELEKQFEVKKYLSSSERTDMAKLLSVTETQVSQFERTIQMSMLYARAHIRLAAVSSPAASALVRAKL